MPFEIRSIHGGLELEQAFDLRRTVFCGELHYARDLVEDGQDPGAWLGLALDGERPVGTLRLRQVNELWMLELLAVLPSKRRQGLGRALVEAALDFARGQKAPSILAVAPLQTQAFFSRLGFDVARQEGSVIVLHKAFS